MKSIKNTDNSFYKNILDRLFDGICLVDREGRIIFWNKGAEKLTGYKSPEIVGAHCSDKLLMHINDKDVTLGEGQCSLEGTMADGWGREEKLYLRHKEGHRVSVTCQETPIRGAEGQFEGVLQVYHNNSSMIGFLRKMEALEKMALLDPLTEIGNRRYAETNLHTRLEEMHRYGWPFGIISFDIDNLKIFNDKYGHDLGDRVLKMVARSLVSSVRSFDIVSRWGGDEFLAIIINVDEEQLFLIAEKLRVLSEESSLSLGDTKIQATISVGATLARSEDTVDRLLKRADKLVYRSKHSGKNNISMSLSA